MARNMSNKSFMDLPAEIRIRIYGFLFNDTVHLQRPGVSPLSISLGSNKPLHIAPLLVSKRFREECIVEYLRNSKLYIDDERDFFWVQQEMKVLFGDNMEWSKHVRRILFRIKWSGDALRYIEFLGRCSDVKEVTLAIDAPLPMTASLISWTFHLHLLEEKLSGLDYFKLHSLAGYTHHRWHVLMRQLQESLGQKILRTPV